MVLWYPACRLPCFQKSDSPLKPSSAIIWGMSGVDLLNCGFGDISVTSWYHCQIKILSPNRNVLSFLDLDFAKNSDYWLLYHCAYSKAYLWSHAMSRLYTSMKNQRLTMTIFKGTERSATWKESSWSFGGPKADLLWEIYGQIGLLEGEVSLKLSSEAKPVQLSLRAVPQSIMPELKKELDKVEGIIRAWTETTKWLHNLVTAVKKDGTLRLCLGPRNLNRYLIQTIHNTASWRDVQHSSRDGQFFSTLDAKSGYWTKQLNEQRQLLTAFNTPFKKYCFRNHHAQVLEVEPTRSQSLHEERHWPYYYWMAR